MSNKAKTTPAKNDRLAPSQIFVGGGIGGLAVFGLNSLEIDENVKIVLMTIVPSLSVLCGNIWAIISVYITELIQYGLAKRDLKAVKQHLREIESDPNSTEGHKSAARAEVEEAERSVIRFKMRKFSAK